MIENFQSGGSMLPKRRANDTLFINQNTHYYFIKMYDYEKNFSVSSVGATIKYP